MISTQANSSVPSSTVSEPISIKLNYIVRKDKGEDQLIEDSLPSLSPLENLQLLKDYVANQFNTKLMNTNNSEEEEPISKIVKVIKVKDLKSGKKFRVLHNEEDWTNAVQSILQSQLDHETTQQRPLVVDFKIRMKKQRYGKKEKKDKSERKEKKHFKKQERSEHSAMIHTDDISLFDDDNAVKRLDTSIRRIIIDGNNLFFQTGTLRGLILKSKKKSLVEELLVHMARMFSQFSELTWNQPMDLMHVVFDASSSQVNGTFNDGTFVVSSAKKEGFTIADDMLVELANRQNIAGTLDSCLFVTSDRGLRERLKLVGAKCIKSGRWMSFAHAHLCTNPATTSIDEWTGQLLNEISQPRND